jgi:hypothetical protein
MQNAQKRVDLRCTSANWSAKYQAPDSAIWLYGRTANVTFCG